MPGLSPAITLRTPNVTRYAGAGHPPLLRWRQSTGKAEEICENGLVLGQFPEATYDAVQVCPKPGDRLVLYTDGIPEAPNLAKEQYGIERFKEFVEAHHDLPGSQFADKLLDELVRWSGLLPGQTQGDDITLLTIQFNCPRA
jgi:phosphoserine phosphatase RsbU/P